MCEFGVKEPHDVAVVRERSAPVENTRGAVVIESSAGSEGSAVKLDGGSARGVGTGGGRWHGR